MRTPTAWRRVSPTNALYVGWVTHQRHAVPGTGNVAHRFRYRMTIPFINLEEIPKVSHRTWTWRYLVSFHRGDFFGAPDTPLVDAVRNEVERQSGHRPNGPIFLLAQWRMWRVHFNPLSVYYCYDESGERVTHLVLEVRNTPWRERHCYVLDTREAEIEKTFHVSPFLGMDHRYRVTWSEPGEHVRLHLANWRGDEHVFDAAFSLSRRALTTSAMRRFAVLRGWENAAVSVRIYWQALRLTIRRAPYFAHPDSKMKKQ